MRTAELPIVRVLGAATRCQYQVGGIPGPMSRGWVYHEALNIPWTYPPPPPRHTHPLDILTSLASDTWWSSLEIDSHPRQNDRQL